MKFELKKVFQVLTIVVLLDYTLCKNSEINETKTEPEKAYSHNEYQGFEDTINITQTPKDVYSGGTVFFMCKIRKITDEIPDYEFQWTRNFQILTTNGTRKITSEKEIDTLTIEEIVWYNILLKSTLEINTLNSDDEGRYCCDIDESNEECISLSLTTDKPKGKTSNKDIYEASMIALACFMITIIGLFVLFLCNRSFFRRGSPVEGNERRSSDLFNVGAELEAMRHIDKPPTYDQVVSQDRVVRGMPPPSYNDLSIDSRLAASINARTQSVRFSNGHRLLTRATPTTWPSEGESSDPAVLNVTSFSRITLIHTGRRGAVRYNGRPNRRPNEGHIDLEETTSGTQGASSLGGSVNAAFVSDA